MSVRPRELRLAEMPPSGGILVEALLDGVEVQTEVSEVAGDRLLGSLSQARGGLAIYFHVVRVQREHGGYDDFVHGVQTSGEQDEVAGVHSVR